MNPNILSNGITKIYNNGTIDGAFLKVKYASVKETSTEHFFIFIVCLLSRL